MTWQYNPQRGDITDPGVSAEQAKMETDVYAYYGGDLIAESIRIKNGPLLAAAPDMLDALKGAKIRMTAMFNSYIRKTYHESSNPDNDLQLSLIDIDAAIKKAEGGE